MDKVDAAFEAHNEFARKAAPLRERIATLEAALRKINAINDSPARFNAEIQGVLDSVIDTSDHKF